MFCSTDHTIQTTFLELTFHVVVIPLMIFSHTSKKSLTCKVWRPFYFCRRNSLLSSIFSTVSQARSFYFLTRYCQQSLKQKNQKSTTNTPSKNNFEQNIIFCVDILIGPMGLTNKTEQNIALNFDLRKNSSSLYMKNER